MEQLTIEKLRQNIKEIDEIKKTQKMLDKVIDRLKNKHKVEGINLKTCLGSVETIKMLLEFDFMKKQSELEGHCAIENIRRRV